MKESNKNSPMRDVPPIEVAPTGDGAVCTFCKIIRGEIPCTKVFEDEHTLAFLNINPDKPGHTLVIPKQHYRNLFDVPHDVLYRVMTTVQKIAKKYKCVKIIQNNERPLQEVFHLHFHVIPH